MHMSSGSVEASASSGSPVFYRARPDGEGKWAATLHRNTVSCKQPAIAEISFYPKESDVNVGAIKMKSVGKEFIIVQRKLRKRWELFSGSCNDIGEQVASFQVRRLSIRSGRDFVVTFGDEQFVLLKCGPSGFNFSVRRLTFVKGDASKQGEEIGEFVESDDSGKYDVDMQGCVAVEMIAFIYWVVLWARRKRGKSLARRSSGTKLVDVDS